MRISLMVAIIIFVLISLVLLFGIMAVREQKMLSKSQQDTTPETKDEQTDEHSV